MKMWFVTMLNNLMNNKYFNKENIFYILYSLYLLFSLLNKTFFFQYYNVFAYKIVKFAFLFALLVFEFIKDKNDKTALIGLGICLLLYGYSSYFSSLTDSLAIILLFSSRRENFEKIAKLTLIIQIFVLLITIFCAKVGIIENYISYDGIRTREYLGFLYALYPSVILFNITCLTVYLNRDSNENIIIKVILLILANVLIFIFTKSRLSFAFSMILIVCFCFIKLKPDLFVKISENKVYQFITNYSFVIFCVVSALFTALYSPNVGFLNKINSFLGDRVRLAKQSLDLYGVKLFGIKDIGWVGNGLNAQGQSNVGAYLWVDNLYVNVMQKFGIVFIVCALVVLTITMIKCSKQKKYMLLFILALISLRCIIDDLQLHLYYNTFWFIIPQMLMCKDGTREL